MQENNALIPYMFIYSTLTNKSVGNFIYTYKGNENFTGFKLKTTGYLGIYFPFLHQNETYPIKGSNRFYILGRGPTFSLYAAIQKAEYDFATASWHTPDFGQNKNVHLKFLEKLVRGIKCAQVEELGDQATCIVFTGVGTNYVILYDPGDLKTTPQGKIVGTKEINIPQNQVRIYNDSLANFDLGNNLLIKSTYNLREEFEVRYSEEGERLRYPLIHSNDGFMVWNLTSKSKGPAIIKYFPTHFTDFTLAGDLIWTCSPQDEPSAVFNLSLGINISNQMLTIPDVEYLRGYFGSMYLKANSLNGTVIKVPFNQMFSLPTKNNSGYAFIILGVLVISMVLFCLACKAKGKRMMAVRQTNTIHQKRPFSHNDGISKLIPETEPSSTLTYSRFRNSIPENPTTLTDETSEHVML